MDAVDAAAGTDADADGPHADDHTPSGLQPEPARRLQLLAVVNGTDRASAHPDRVAPGNRGGSRRGARA